MTEFVLLLSISIMVYKVIRRSRRNKTKVRPEEITEVEWQEEKEFNRPGEPLSWSKLAS